MKGGNGLASGWHREPARHSLAARGVRTRIDPALKRDYIGHIDTRRFKPTKFRNLTIWEDTGGSWIVADYHGIEAEGDYDQPPGSVYITLYKATPEGRGVGRRAYKDLEAYWKSRGFKQIYGEVTGDSIGFWEKMGFYPLEGHDDVLMMRKVIA